MIVTLYRTAADGRMHYYTIHDRQQVLDAPFALCASWRIGMGREREKLHRCETLGERDRLIRTLIGQRTRAGYKILYSFSRAGFVGETGPLLDAASL
ncbi:MAG TPA: hypothetical protein VFL04_03805 [Rectinemataceae bacterium]|nr:hypothetical protein [Rectinemataceae bacterium]